MGRRRASTSGRQVIPVRGLWLLHALWCGNSCTSTSVRLRTPSGTAHALQPGAAGVANGGARDASPIPDDATLLALSYSTHPFCAKPEAERPRQSVGPGRSGCERHCCAPAPVPPDQHASHSAEFSPGSRRHFLERCARMHLQTTRRCDSTTAHHGCRVQVDFKGHRQGRGERQQAEDQEQGPHPELARRHVQVCISALRARDNY